MGILEEVRCHNHPDRLATMVCITCKGEYICGRCVSSEHMKHTCMDAEGYTENKKEALQHLLQKATSKVSSLDFKRKRIEKIFEQNQRNLDSAVSEAKKRSKDLKAMIEKLTDDFITFCKDVTHANKQKMEKLDVQFAKDLKSLQIEIENCKQVLGNERFKEYGPAEKQLRSIVSKPNDKTPVLINPALKEPKRTPAELETDLKRIFGALEKQEWKLEQSGLTDKDQSTVSPPAPLVQKSTFVATVTASFELPGQKYIRSICPIDDERAWVVSGGSHEAHLMNLSGDILQSASVSQSSNNPSGIWITDITLTREGDDCYFCCGDGAIWRVNTEGKLTCMFNTRSYTNSISLTDRGDYLAVCRHREQNIIKCNLKGKVEDTIDKDDMGRQLFAKPVCIRINQSTGDMAILEANIPRHLIVLRSDLRIVGRYYGNQMDLNQEDIDDEFFQPWDACFDSTGNIVVADGKSRSLLLLSKDGKEIRTLLEDEVGPTSLGVNKNGDIWVGFDYGTVKVLKYSL